MLPLGDLLFDQRLSSAAMKVLYLSLGSDSVCPRVLAGGYACGVAWSSVQRDQPHLGRSGTAGAVFSAKQSNC